MHCFVGADGAILMEFFHVLFGFVILHTRDRPSIPDVEPCRPIYPSANVLKITSWGDFKNTIIFYTGSISRVYLPYTSKNPFS